MRPFNSSEKRFAIAALLIGCCCAIIVSYRIYSDARSRHSESLAVRASYASDVARLRSLLARDTIVDDRPRAEQDLLARLRDVLRKVGASPGDVSDVRIDEPRAVQRTNRFTQSAEATISAMKTGAIAEFLASWSNEEPLWAITSIRIDHEHQTPRNRNGSQADSRYQAIIQFENVFVRAARKIGTTE